MIPTYHRWHVRLAMAAATVLAALAAPSAQAVPSYARQTGQDCVACHIGAFGPQLTPYGIKFKLGGYIDSDGKAGKVPLSAMLVADYTRFNEDNSNGDGTQVTSSKVALTEASIFLAGKLTDHIGSFVQVTHDGGAHSTSLDQADVRYANTVTAYGKEALVGVSVNNAPTLQDPFNTTAVWGFPYTTSNQGNAMGAETFGFSKTEHKVVGVNGYALLDDSIYAELGLYNTVAPAVQSRLGLSRSESADFGRLNNAPYWRLGYLKDLRTSAWSVGLLGMNGSIKDRHSDNLVTRFKDLGVDATYQFLGTRQHVLTVNGSILRETTTSPLEDGSVDRNTQKDYRLTASYHFMNTYGATIGSFRSTNANQEASNRGFTYQADWTPWGKESSWYAPWANLQVGLQYVAYKRYTDAVTDDTGATTFPVLSKPSDKNTLRLFAWTSF